MGIRLILLHLILSLSVSFDQQLPALSGTTGRSSSIRLNSDDEARWQLDARYPCSEREY